MAIENDDIRDREVVSRKKFHHFFLSPETVPAFEDTWIECVGDIDRYRMAIEDDDIRMERSVRIGVF